MTSLTENTEMRFKVTFKHIGKIHELEQKAEMRFRVSMFWNDIQNKQPRMKESFKMKGPRMAELPDGSHFDVPQVELVNRINISNSSDAEVHSLNEETGLFRWTREYTGSFMQEIDVKQFPYDVHDLKLTLGISVYKEVGRVIRRASAIKPATIEDNERQDGEPYGEIKDHVQIPGFVRKDLKCVVNKRESCGALKQTLQYIIPVRRVHSFHENVIIPLLLLHIIAILSALMPIDELEGLEGRISTLLSIAFIEIGMKFIFDKSLPTVSYTVLVQNMVNHLFYALLALAIKDYFLYFFYVKLEFGKFDDIGFYYIELVFACFAISPMVWIVKKMYTEHKKTFEWEVESEKRTFNYRNSIYESTRRMVEESTRRMVEESARRVEQAEVQGQGQTGSSTSLESSAEEGEHLRALVL